MASKRDTKRGRKMSKKWGRGYEFMEVECDKADVMIIDIGYVNDEKARNRADRLFTAGISRKNLIWGPSTGQPRIHIKIPNTKRSRIRSQFPISNKKTWFGANYSWLED